MRTAEQFLHSAPWWAPLGALVLLSACRGIPTEAEKASRAQAATVAAEFRPQGRKPPLPVLTTNSSLGDLLRFALLNQPQVAAAYYDWAAAIERITAARSLPDPVLTFQMDVENIVTSIMPGLMVNFPGPGKLRAGAEIASAESQASYYAFESAILESAFEVKSVYYRLHFLQERIRVSRDNLRRTADLERLARAQNAVGKVTLQDVLRAQLEHDRLVTEIADLEDSRNALMAEYRSALGLAAGAPAPPVPAGFESTSLDLSSDQVFVTALANNTRLKALAAQVRAAEAAINLAHKANRPDSSLGLMADAKMSPTLYRPLATISLPIWRDKIAAQIAEAQANHSAAGERLSLQEINLAVDFAEKSFRHREATRNLALLNEQLLPKARQSLQLARIGYLSGQIDFFNLSDSERTLLDFELDAVEAALQRELALTELSLLVQGLPAGGAQVSAIAGPPGAPASGGQMNRGM